MKGCSQISLLPLHDISTDSISLLCEDLCVNLSIFISLTLCNVLCTHMICPCDSPMTIVTDSIVDPVSAVLIALSAADLIVCAHRNLTVCLLPKGQLIQY